MEGFALDAEAGRVSEELSRRGIGAKTCVRIFVEIIEAQDLPMASTAQAGGAFDFLTGEPDLYTDADLHERNE